jgi:hypothetical protein
LEHKLINNRIRWYQNILRKNKREIPKKVLNTKIRGRPISRWGKNGLGNMSRRREKEYGGNMRRRRFGKAEVDGEAWFSENHVQWKFCRKNK